MGCEGSAIMKNFIQNTKILTWYPAGHIQRLPLDCMPKKTLTTEFTGIRTEKRPRFNWQECVKVVRSNFSGVVNGNWSCRTEQFGGISYGRPRLDRRL
jgi:hypothetical protein